MTRACSVGSLIVWASPPQPPGAVRLHACMDLHQTPMPASLPRGDSPASAPGGRGVQPFGSMFTRQVT